MHTQGKTSAHLDRERRVFLFAGRIQLGPYWLAFLSAVLGVVLRLLIDPWLGDQMPYLTFLFAVALTGLYAGTGPAIFCTGLGGLFAYFCFVPPRYRFGFAGTSDWVGFLTYLAVALSMVALTRALTKAHGETERTLRDRILAERKAREAQKLLQLFLENWPGCAYLRNENRRYVYYNNYAGLFLGIAKEPSASDSQIRVILENHDRAALGAYSNSLQFVDKLSVAGEERYWLTSKFLFTDEGEQKLVGSLSIDITSQMQAEQVALETARLAAATQMVSMVAHEINNPLAAVTNLFFLLGREAISRRVQELVAIAQTELARLTYVSKLAIGLYAQTEAAESLDPCRLLEDVLPRVLNNHPDTHVKIQSDVRWKGTFIACADQMCEVLESVLSNSLESGASRIHIRVVRSSDWRMPSRPGLRVSILDDGRGMKPQERKKAFEPFFCTRNDKGTGLGLWITKAIALRNDGHISVRSTDCERRHGTCVSVFFPERVPLSSIGPSALHLASSMVRR